MEVPQHIAQLLGPLNDVLLRLGAVLLQCLVQGVALHVVHDDDERILRINHVDDTRQIRVAQLLEDIRLRHQTLLHGFKIQYTVLADLLYCPGLVRLLIDGHIYDTHAAVSDLVEDLIFSVNEGSYLQHPVPSIFQNVLMVTTEMLSRSRRCLFSSISASILRCIPSASVITVGFR